MISIRQLAKCLGFPREGQDTFSIRDNLLSWVSPPPPFSLLQQVKQIYCYRVDGVPDIDQRWSSLPNDGKMYCVPTATMNWLYSMGEPPSPPDPATTIQNLTLLGAMMGTDPEGGTTFGGTIDGLEDWLYKRQASVGIIGHSVYSDGARVRIDYLRAWATMGGLVNVIMGRYVQNEGELIRESGHMMTMIGLHQSNDRTGIIVHDPADESSDLTSQSATTEVTESLANECWNIEGDMTTLIRWGTLTDKIRLIDGFVVLAPSSAVTNLSPGVLTHYQAELKTGRIATQSFRLPFSGEVVDLAMHPALPRVAVVGKGSGEVWMLDLTNGAWSRIAGLRGPQLLSFGGRAHRLFVVQERELISIDVETGAMHGAELPVPIDALTYNAHTNHIVLASVRAKTMLSLAPNLALRSEQKLPEASGGGRLFLTADPRDGTIIMTRAGSSEITTLHLEPSGVGTQAAGRLATTDITSAAQGNRRGTLYVTEQGRIGAFDREGSRMPTAVFVGLAAGPLLQVLRSQHNFDPQRAHLRRWRNGGAPQQGGAEPWEGGRSRPTPLRTPRGEVP